jgi:DNA-binding NarL/FixJ family response regulator
MPDGTRVAVSIVYPVAAGPKSAVVQRVDLYGLTGPEVRLLQMLAAGLTDSQIAGVLESNQDEVVRQMSSMLSKMGVASRTAGAVLAIKHHLVL